MKKIIINLVGSFCFLAHGVSLASRDSSYEIFSKGSSDAGAFLEDNSLYFGTYIDNQFYISPKLHSDQGSNYVNVGSYLKVSREYQYWFYNLESKIKLSLDRSNEHYFSLSSANLGYQLEDIQVFSKLRSLQVSIGRYKRVWSWMNDHWLLGLWNPSNLYDYFSPEALGIIGSSIVLKGDQWSFINFVGGIYFPNQQSPMENNARGQFISKSRWASPPKSSISMFDSHIKAYYWMEKPYLNNVLFQSSYMASFVLGDLQKQWISLSYGNKPINQIYFRSKSGLSIPDSSLESFINYHQLRHQLITIESGLQLNSWKFFFGIIDEKLDLVNLPSNWLAPQLDDSFFISASLLKDIQLSSWGHHRLILSYLNSRLTRENSSDSPTGENFAAEISLDRFRIKEGFSIDWISSFPFQNNKKITSELLYWYSIDQKGGWLKWDLSYYLDSRFWIYTQISILGTDQKKNQASGFFKRYAHNDRFSAGVHYGF